MNIWDKILTDYWTCIKTEYQTILILAALIIKNTVYYNAGGEVNAVLLDITEAEYGTLTLTEARISTLLNS